MILVPTKCDSCGTETGDFVTEHECYECWKKECVISRAAKLELAARWFERIGQPVPDYVTTKNTLIISLS